MEDENYIEIDNYLKKIAKIKSISKHVIVGDFNLSKTTWPDGVSSSKVETSFLNTFQDVGFTQFITTPTHEDGRILDLLLSDSPLNFISDLHVLEQNKVCNSDHYGITFSLELNVKRIKCPKRKIYNYKKAKWDELNNDLKRIKWDYLLKNCNAQRAWTIFKNILCKLCDKNIPKISIKSQFQPPWFDSDMHKICKKKERLRAKFKRSHDPEDYEKFKECRKHFKKNTSRKNEV